MESATNKLAQRAKPVEIISHWPKLIENLRFSSHEFYTRVEKALSVRQVPDLVIKRVDWKEGGPLSARREYLRLTRERLIFDVCGAPFGTGFFVSLWCGQKPLRIGPVLCAILVIVLLGFIDSMTLSQYGIYHFAWRYWGFSIGDTNGLLAGIVGTLVIVVIVRVGPNLDNVLIRVPVVGYFYEKYFRSITYYRIDRMCMYQQAVRAAVFEVIDEITAAQAIKPLSEFERMPVMRELFQPRGSDGRR
jgi:hypothetical protein